MTGESKNKVNNAGLDHYLEDQNQLFLKQSVCQILNTEFPGFSPTFFQFSPTLHRHFSWLFPDLYLNSLTFPCLFKEKTEFPDFSRTSLTSQTPCEIHTAILTIDHLNKLCLQFKFQVNLIIHCLEVAQSSKSLKFGKEALKPLKVLKSSLKCKKKSIEMCLNS